MRTLKILCGLSIALIPLRAAQPAKKKPHAQQTSTSGAAAIPAPPVTRPGRLPGAGYGERVPADRMSQAQDRPDLRLAWFMGRRSYPTGKIDAQAYAAAAEAYLRGREATRQRAAANRALAGGARLPDALPTGPWAAIGPAPINNSLPGLNFGNVAGRISTIAVHPTNANILIAGASKGGIWRSSDGGTNWTAVGDNLPTLVIADIEFAPSNPNIVYAASGDDDVYWWGMGVYKSSDGGITWARADNATPASGIENGTVLSKLTVDPVNANAVIAAGYYRQGPTGTNFFSFIFRSTDGGATWSHAAIPSGGNQAEYRSLVIDRNCPAQLWAVNIRDAKIERSLDSGATWTAVAATGLPAMTAFSTNSQIAVSHASCAGNPVVWISDHSGDGLAGSPNYPGVYRSTDGGANFSLPGAAGPSGGCLRQCAYDHFLFADPGDSNRVYMLGRDIWSSLDGGATWTNRSAGFDDSNNYFGGNMHVDLHDAALSGSGGTATLFIAGDGGLWSYDVAGNVFTNRNGNLAISEFIDLAIDPDTPDTAIGGLQDNGSIVWSGVPAWTAKVGGDGGDGGWLRSIAGAANPFDGGFTTYVYNRGYKSTDNGATFSAYADDTSFAGEQSEFYAPWIATVGDNRVWHAAQSLWYSNFPSPTWTKMGTTNLAALSGSLYVSKLAINNPTAGVFGPFYAGNASPRAFLQSSDGLTWNNRTGTLPNKTISDIAFNPAAPAQVWVTFLGFGTGHLFYSGDGGTTWSDKSGNLPNVPVNDIQLDPMDPAATWYLGTDSGVYGTADGGTTWSVVGSNLPAAVVSDLEIDSNRMLYAATGGRSVWRIQLPGAVCSFGGLTSATNNSTATCKLDLAWSAASAPCGAPLRYNVYRSTVSGALGSRIGACLTGTSYSDQSAVSGTPYFYTVRYETPVPGSGPCGGTEDANLIQRGATAGGSATFTAFSDTFETGAGLNGWTAGLFNTGALGNDAVDWRGIETCVNHTLGGIKDFRFGGTTCAAAYGIEKWSFVYPGGATGVAIPAGATATRLSFWHEWDFEPGYDGAQLLISTGGSYFFVPSAAILSGGYNSTVIDDVGFCGYARPSAGSRIWSGTSTAAFTNVIVNLDAACNAITGNVGGCAGKSVRIAFAGVTDCSGVRTGWFLDDVQVTYSASAACAPAAPPGEVSGGAIPLKVAKSGVDLTFSWQDQALAPQDYNLYRGTPGTWYSHAIYACHLTTPAINCAAGVCSVSGQPAGSGNQYFLLTSSNPGGESNAGASGWSGPNHTVAPAYTVPAACGGN